MEKIVLLCEDSIEGMLTAIYDGFVLKNEKFSGKPGALADHYEDNIRIHPRENYEYEMFTSIIQVETDDKKADQTISAIRRKLGEEAYLMVLRALCHYDEDRASDVFAFLVRGFQIGTGIVKKLGDAYVMSVMELSRKAANEAHSFIEFIRFEDTGDVLYARIEPKCNVLPLIARHFAGRFPNENFIIYDEVRKLSLVHKKFEDFFFVKDSEANIPGTVGYDVSTEVWDYKQLWSAYFESTAIEDRKNPKCQKNLLPLWYRKNMLEFSEKKVDK